CSPVRALGLPADNGQTAVPLQEVANRNLGQRIVSLPSTISEAGQEPCKFALPIDELKPSLMLIGDLDEGRIVVLPDPACPLTHLPQEGMAIRSWGHQTSLRGRVVHATGMEYESGSRPLRVTTPLGLNRTSSLRITASQT